MNTCPDTDDSGAHLYEPFHPIETATGYMWICTCGRFKMIFDRDKPTRIEEVKKNES